MSVAELSVIIHSYTLQVAVPDLVETATGADILVFVLPHQFVRRICSQLKGHVKSGAYGISLIKVRRQPRHRLGHLGHLYQYV